MSAYIVSRLIQNGLWLALVLTAAVLAARVLTEGAAGLSAQEAALILTVVLGGGMAVDALGYREKIRSPLRKNLLAALAAASLLFVLELLGMPFVPPAGFVLPVFLLFVLFRSLADLLAQHPSWLSRRVLLLGGGGPADTVRDIIRNSNGRFVLARHMGEEELAGEGRTGAGDDLAALAREDGITTVIVSFADRRGAMPVRGLLRCRMQGVTVLDVPTFYEAAARKLYLESTVPSWFIFSRGFCLSFSRRAGKRAFDVLGALFGLLLLAPVMPLIALAVRLDSPGPALFRQVRTGLGGRPFTLFKFRTMRADAEKSTGAVWAARHDSRVTRLGRFLRQTRLDETPQLFNVLMGQMSLVGPRPERPEFIENLEKDIPFYSERHSVKPGVTGWAQVRYPYGSSVEDSLEKLRYDLYYIKNQSFMLDMEIVLRTIAVVLLRCGAR